MLGGVQDRLGFGPWELLICLLGALTALNVLAFAAAAGTPLPISDDWFFIEAFIAPALDGTLGLRDFFVQRIDGDHAQPLQKLVLLAQLHWFELDFRPQAVFGALCAVLAVGLLARVAAGPFRVWDRRALVAAGIILLAGLSLNATTLYNWPLVAVSWMLLLLAIIYWALLARQVAGWGMAVAALPATFMLALALDEVAIIAFAAGLGALLVRDGFRRPQAALVLLAGGGAGLLLGRLVIGWLSPVADGGQGITLQELLSLLASGDAWRLVVGPLSDSVVHPFHLRGRPATWLPWLIALVLCAAHVGFWWRALVSRRHPAATALVLSIACMLFFYASIAGIAVSRMPTFGVEYVHQQRYVLLYQFNLIALALMFFGPPAVHAGADRPAEGESWSTRPLLALGMVALVSLLGIQLWLTHRAWSAVSHLADYDRQMAAALGALGRDPGQDLPDCPGMMTICTAPLERREKLVGLLVTHRLNLFSARFRSRYGYADPSPARTGEDDLACRAALLEWGPRVIPHGEGFNVQADGRSAHWLRVEPGAGPFELRHRGQRLPVSYDEASGVISFLHPEASEAAHPNEVFEFELACAGAGRARYRVPVAAP